jgi:hypothetical protein
MYRCKNQGDSFNGERVEIFFVYYSLILLVAEPHCVYDLLYEL